MSDKLSNSALSLAVAKTMNLDYISHTSVCKEMMGTGMKCECGGSMNFKHTTDDALGKMCVWLAKAESGHLEGTHEGIHIYNMMLEWMASDNPHRAIAEAIVEVSND